jgi:DNA gyrase/topoisomerase IV subunit B
MTTAPLPSALCPATVNTQDLAVLPELTATALRALMLYCLAEHQSGNASTILVTAEGASFSISDDGRGHPIDKTVEGTSYLRFIYTHFDYPFESVRDAPIQLQGIGMSLVNALCSELELTVKKRDAELRLRFHDGQLVGSTRTEVASEETGITVSARIAPHLCTKRVASQSIEDWLLRVLATAPSLRLFFNGRQLQPPPHGAA